MSEKDMAQKIKDLRLSQNLTLEQVANEVGVGKSTVRKWETGMIANMRRDKIASLAKALHTTPAYLMGWIDEPHREITLDNLFRIETKKFPLLGNIACGEPIFANEERELYVEAGANIQADFCLRAKGDSMIGARIYDGDIVFIKQQPMVEDGEIAAVLIEDEATLKRVYYDRENGVLQLFAENPQYKTMRFVGEELNQIRIIGRAVAFQSDVR
ncbi:LexA family protein [Anaerotruncus colihominis]|uniref:LexA family protein n=1 Tax=Anaerotruncus colihominis TaxID=169435 RepID=UPI0018AC840F|nr:S24 family peptidase [Anaerotruncus colihominis]MCQ4735145.1 helix-turn-helix domain-containing protein [Anaerotruncus colihominis]